MPVSPEYAEGLAKALLEVYADAEDQLLGRIAARVATGTDGPLWATEQLAQVQALRDQTRNLIAQLQGNANPEIVNAIITAYNQGAALAGADLVATAGVPAAVAFGGVQPQAVAALVDTAKQSLGAMAMVIQSQAEAVFVSVVQETAGRMLAGTMTRREASASVILRLADRGVTGFVDKAGRNWSMSSYAEMVARTASSQAIIAGHVDRLADTGHDLVMISDAPEECEKCRRWEGRILSTSGNTPAGSYVAPNGSKYTVAGSLSDATSDGLFHPNCRHRTGIYVPGLTRPLVDTEDPEGDRIRQEQRKQERQIRKLKRTAQVVEGSRGPRSGPARAARANVQAANADHKAWREANGRKDLAYRRSITPPKGVKAAPYKPRTLPEPDGALPAAVRPAEPLNLPRAGDLTPEDKIRQAEETFGTGSREHREVVTRFAPKKPGRVKRPLPADVIDYNTRELRLASDDKLEEALGRAYAADHPNADRIGVELDRRADAPLKAAQDKARRADAARAKRSANQEAQWAEVSRRIDAGEDPRSAVADVTGVSIEKQLRTEAFHRLKASGSRGDTLDEMIRNDYKADIYRRHIQAEDACRGHLLSKEGNARNARYANNARMQIDPLSLFNGPEVRARKWASDELKEWWDQNGRPTLDDYKYEQIHGHGTGERGVDDFYA